MIDEREGISIIYVVFMTAVILALVIFFGLRSHYTANASRDKLSRAMSLR